MPLSEEQARSIGRQTARSLLNGCYIKASQGLDDLSLIDDIARTSTLFLKANTPWSTLKDFFNIQVGFSPQALERINKQIDYMHESIDEATKLNIAPRELRNQMRILFTALRNEAEIGVLEDLVDCACKYKGGSETKVRYASGWTYAKVGQTEMRGKDTPTGIEFEQVSPTYDPNDLQKAVDTITAMFRKPLK